MSATVSGITVDCRDPARLAAFWGALLDLPEAPTLPGWRRLGTRGGPGLRINFQPVPEVKSGKNRVHLDVTVNDIDRAVDRVLSLGGEPTGERHDYPEGVVVVMRDPELNEFCVVEYFEPREGLRFVAVDQNDPLAAPLLDELSAEYHARYGPLTGTEYEDLRAYPPVQFAPPGGALILALVDGVPVAGGAFRQYDASTAELKRMWTASAHRGKGYGKLVVAELERVARERGYRRVYLTTGPRQPEAVALYLSAGYTPLYDRSLPAEEVGVHPFEKSFDGG